MLTLQVKVGPVQRLAVAEAEAGETAEPMPPQKWFDNKEAE